jgi:DNA-binding Xre family transcriptional regulator
MKNMALEWRLRKVMAEREIWSGSELARRMKEKAGYSLSAPSISALLNDSPKHVKAETMDALCTALECTPSDLWKHTPTYTQSADNKKQTKLAKASNDDRLPPI